MLIDHLTTLCDLPGPVGHERPVIDYLESTWSRFGDTRRDRIGNLTANIGGTGPKVLLQAHADEICLCVKSITSDGFLMVTRGTASSDREHSAAVAYPFQRVMVLAADRDPVPGFIGIAYGHVRSPEQIQDPTVRWRDLFVDIGATSESEVLESGIRPGTPIIFATRTSHRGDRVTAKALDDRAGLAIMTELASRLNRDSLRCELHLGATVQEEIALVGSVPMVADQPFDLAICVEVGLSGDIPTIKDEDLPCRLGAGPILVTKDSMVHYDVRLTRILEQQAEAAGIPIQHAVFGSYASDGREFMRAGIPTALIAFATRYTHSSRETASLKDMEDIITVLTRTLTTDNTLNLTW